jgi:hypothetical protein
MNKVFISHILGWELPTATGKQNERKALDPVKVARATRMFLLQSGTETTK